MGTHPLIRLEPSLIFLFTEYARTQLFQFSLSDSFSVFPGGFLPTLTFLLDTLQTGSKGKLTVDSVSNIGPHYARTLREWRKRFLKVFDTKIVPALQAQYPDVMSGPRGKQEIQVFKRKWICEYSVMFFCVKNLIHPIRLLVS